MEGASVSPWRAYLPGALSALGVALALVAALDDKRGAAVLWLGPVFALAGVAARRWLGRGSLAPALALATLAMAFSAGAASRPDMHRADFEVYFALLHSAAFDHDLNLWNEAEHFPGWPERAPTPTGHRPAHHAVGVPILWSPFFLLAHIYVRLGNALGFTAYSTAGYSAPYVRSALVGTLTYAVAGAWALGWVLARRYGRTVASLSVLGAIFSSTILAYLFVQPGMPHGLVFALASFDLWAIDRASERPSPGRYALVGLFTGLLVLVRYQAAAFAFVALPLVAAQLWRRKVRLSSLAWAAAAAFLAFSPQLLAWKLIFGRWITIGGGLDAWAAETKLPIPILQNPGSWLDPRSPHLLDVLFSADHGLFTWTPAVLVGLIGLLFALRRAPFLACGGLLAFVATAWFNGCFADITAGDSFGARRFDMVVPIVALGFAGLLEAAARYPLAAPGLLVSVFCLWNLGVVRLWRAGELNDAAPLQRLARLQAAQLQSVSVSGLDRVAGASGRAFGYRLFVGEYLFWNASELGSIDLGDPAPAGLGSGWSAAVNRAGPPQYRTALFPRACVRFPLMVAAPLQVRIVAKAPGRVATQAARVTLNGQSPRPFLLGADWVEVLVETPGEAALAGPNQLCLEFSVGVEKGDDGRQIAAHVKSIVLSSVAPVTPNPVWGLAHWHP
ncbi:MAG TPA: glycosyltransferase family 39 protein [Vicinamibacteria bacterium]|nr:glycosyltransferase family 39 protein [Vicinamibacteria bacterium]